MSARAVTTEQQAILAKSRRLERHRWIYVHLEGTGRERGFQHGCLLAREIGEGLRSVKVGWQHQSAMTWPWLVDKATALFAGKIDDECLAELGWIAEGATAAGIPVTREEIIAFNAKHYLKTHPQFDWMRDALKDRPSQPWVAFRAGE